MKPTLEEVKEFFKDAKVVKNKYACTFNYIGKITERYADQFWITHNNTNYTLWDERHGYAEIVEYKQQEIMNKELIDKLAKGEIAVINSGTNEELNKVLKEAFISYAHNSWGTHAYYFAHETVKNEWMCSNKTNLTTVSVKDFFKTEESKEDKLDRLQKELEELRQSIKEDKEFKVGDTVVVMNWRQAGEGNGIHTENLVSKLYSNNATFSSRVSGMLHEEGDFVVEDKGKYFRITRGHIIRKATEEDIENFENRFKLPKIGCKEGEVTEKFIEYGKSSLSKKALRQMQKAGISEVHITDGSDIFKVTRKDLDLIYKAAKNEM